MSQQSKFFPGWLVVASGFVIMATCYTIFVNCMTIPSAPSLPRSVLSRSARIQATRLLLPRVIRTRRQPPRLASAGLVSRRARHFGCSSSPSSLWGLVNGAILPNQVTNMTSVTVNGAKIVTGGHDPMWAGTVLSAYMVTVVIAKISLGAIYDRFGLRFGNILGSVACIIACVALCFPTTDLGPIVAAVSFGVGTCMGTITPTIAASKQFGMADLGKVTGTITLLEMVGGTVGAIVSGILFDATGSFTSTWIVCLACSVAMLVFLLASEPIAAKLRASVAGE